MYTLIITLLVFFIALFYLIGIGFMCAYGYHHFKRGETTVLGFTLILLIVVVFSPIVLPLMLGILFFKVITTT